MEGIGGGGVRYAGAEPRLPPHFLSSSRRLALLLRIARQFAVAEWRQRRSDDDVDELLR